MHLRFVLFVDFKRNSYEQHEHRADDENHVLHHEKHISNDASPHGQSFPLSVSPLSIDPSPTFPMRQKLNPIHQLMTEPVNQCNSIIFSTQLFLIWSQLISTDFYFVSFQRILFLWCDWFSSPSDHQLATKVSKASKVSKRGIREFVEEHWSQMFRCS